MSGMIARPLPSAVDERQLDRFAVLGGAREAHGRHAGACDEECDV
ncbi:hypothetical protein [Agrococcus sp. TSP3-2-1]